MGIVYLAGGGNAEQSKKTDTHFLEHIDTNKPMLYIPLAMPLEKRSYQDCLTWISGTFTNLGYTHITLCSNTEDINEKTLQNASSIYIGGGNTYLLLKLLQEQKFFETIKEYLAKGGIIYGGSAGAVIFGRTIETSSDENTTNMRDLTGLNILNGSHIICHYTQEKDERINKLLAKPTFTKIIAIPEDSSIMYDTIKKEGIVIGNFVKIFTKEGTQEVKSSQKITSAKEPNDSFKRNDNI